MCVCVFFRASVLENKKEMSRASCQHLHKPTSSRTSQNQTDHNLQIILNCSVLLVASRVATLARKDRDERTASKLG